MAQYLQGELQQQRQEEEQGQQRDCHQQGAGVEGAEETGQEVGPHELEEILLQGFSPFTVKDEAGDGDDKGQSEEGDSRDGRWNSEGPLPGLKSRGSDRRTTGTRSRAAAARSSLMEEAKASRTEGGVKARKGVGGQKEDAEDREGQQEKEEEKNEISNRRGQDSSCHIRFQPRKSSPGP